jgi:hypothetical protein
MAAVTQLTVPVLFLDARDSKFYPEAAKAMFAACPSTHKRLLLLSAPIMGPSCCTTTSQPKLNLRWTS